MEIGIGLPNTLRVPGPTIVEWARRAEQRGFASLATIDRIVYPTYDSLSALAVSAGATSRIKLFTDILLTPVYPPVWLAKATASLDAMSGGRLTLGLGVGGRADDFAAMDRPFERRGHLMDETLDLLERAWAGESVTGDDFPVGPEPAAGNRVSVLIGGNSDKAVERTVRYAEGWTMGGGGPDMAAPMIERIRTAWRCSTSASATTRRPGRRCASTTASSATGPRGSWRVRSAPRRRSRRPSRDSPMSASRS
jgi:alkanesulfonate monooxygenase SsuD/methylene tetrahydromethanopterin reductase-like flavin-dependent oxidoreductase (luciferase family)